MSSNNILEQAGFTFTDPKADRKKIVTNTKKFFNSLLNETDKHYPDFTKFLNESVFTLKPNSEMKRHKVKVKIGRKMPEDTQKFYNFSSDNL